MRSPKKTKPCVRKSTPSDNRLIFKYWDGSRERMIDPMEVQRSLTSYDDFNLDIDLKLATSELAGEEAMRALHRVIDAIRRAFGVRSYDGDTNTGLTGGECMSLFYSFATFIDDCKKKLGISQTSLPSAAHQDGPSATEKSSDSSPTEPGSSRPGPSSTQPEPPSCSVESLPENG